MQKYWLTCAAFTFRLRALLAISLGDRPWRSLSEGLV